jgi:hypothetical protein
MGLFNKVSGAQESTPESYLDSGTTLIKRLTQSLPLPDWRNGPPGYTEGENEAIDFSLSQFQRIGDEVARERGGDKMAIHPNHVEDIRRMLAEQGLRRLADGAWRFGDKLPEDWKENLSTYLKAWLCGLNPMVLLDVADLLVHAGRNAEASEAIETVRLFPAYAHSRGSKGAFSAEIVEQVMVRAEELRKDIQLGGPSGWRG